MSTRTEQHGIFDLRPLSIITVKRVSRQPWDDGATVLRNRFGHSAPGCGPTHQYRMFRAVAIGAGIITSTFPSVLSVSVQNILHSDLPACYREVPSLGAAHPPSPTCSSSEAFVCKSLDELSVPRCLHSSHSQLFLLKQARPPSGTYRRLA